MVRAITVAVLGWETSRIKVTPAEIGGGFGGKTTVCLELAAARLSEKAGRPVKLVMSCEEPLVGPGTRRQARIKIGATSDELTAIDGWMAYQVGAYGDFAGMVGAMSASYKFPNLKLESWACSPTRRRPPPIAVGPARRLCHRVGHRRHRKRARHGPDRTATQECRSRG